MNVLDGTKLKKISIESIKSLYNGSYVDNDLVLFDKVYDIPFPAEPRRMQCLFLALCVSGAARYTVDTKESIVKLNEAIIITEGQVLDDYIISNDFRGVALAISYDFFYEIVKDIDELSLLFLFAREHPVFDLHPEEARMIVNYFDIIKLKVNSEDNHFRKKVVRSLIMTMLYDVSNTIYRIQNIGEKQQTRAAGIFAKFLKLVEQNCGTERRVSWYGQQLCITSKYLSETIKEVSHRTPNEWIDNFVTMKIRVLLKKTSKSVKEIAQDMNFPNQSFLGKFFKEHAGMSPSDYRRL